MLFIRNNHYPGISPWAIKALVQKIIFVIILMVAAVLMVHLLYAAILMKNRLWSSLFPVSAEPELTLKAAVEKHSPAAEPLKITKHGQIYEFN